MAGFLDKIAAGVNKGLTTVGANSKALVEKTKVNTAIGSLEKQRSKTFQKLGQAVFDTYQATGSVDTDEKLLNLVEEINRCNAAIAKQHEQLRLIEEEMKRTLEASVTIPQGKSTCHCGYNNAPGYKFCAACGQATEEMTSAMLQGTPPCRCGHANVEGSKFCEACGSLL